MVSGVRSILGYALYHDDHAFSAGGALPNLRLKLPGARVGRIALPRRPASLSAAATPCAGGPVARSLSAIR